MLPTLDPAKKRVGRMLSLAGSIAMAVIINDPGATGRRVEDLGAALRDAPFATAGLVFFLLLFAWLSWDQVRHWLGGKRWRNDKELQHDLYDWLHAKNLKLSDTPIPSQPSLPEVSFAFVAEDEEQRKYVFVKFIGADNLGLQISLKPGPKDEPMIRDMTPYELAELKAELVLELTRHGLSYVVRGDFTQGMDVADEIPLTGMTPNNLYLRVDQISRALVLGSIIIFRHVVRAHHARSQPIFATTPPPSTQSTAATQPE